MRPCYGQAYFGASPSRITVIRENARREFAEGPLLAMTRHSSFSYIIHANSVQRLAFSVDAEVRKRGANMKRQIFIASFGMAATIHPRLLIAQSHMAQVAFLFSSRPPQANPSPFWQAFIEAMRQRGWVEGRNITFHLRATEGIQERYEQLATELVALHPDVIVSPGSQGIQAARERTNAIPIVMVGTERSVGRRVYCQLGTTWWQHYRCQQSAR